LHVETLAIVDMFFERQTAVKGNAEIHWMGTVLKLFFIPTDVKLFVAYQFLRWKAQTWVLDGFALWFKTIETNWKTGHNKMFKG